MDDFDDEERLVRQQIDFLRNRSPDDWHRYAENANWGDRLDVLYWIVRQPQCDQATATLIFWKGEPTGYDWEEDTSVMGDDEYAVGPLLTHIAVRFNTIGFLRSEIAYDFLAAAGHESESPYATAIRDGRHGDMKLLNERAQAISDPLVKLHPDLAVLNNTGRKVGGPGDESDFYDLLPS